jgi:hypothetical protein
MNLLNTIWNNPFTSATGAATAVLTILHALGINTFGIDSGTLAGLFASLGLFAAKDGAKK